MRDFFTHDIAIRGCDCEWIDGGDVREDMSSPRLPDDQEWRRISRVLKKS
jgi:hypothetical protein